MLSRTFPRGVFISVCFAGLLAFAPAAACSADVIASRFPNREAFDQFVAEGRDSPFGLDYVFVHSPGARDRELVDSFCAAVGVRWVNLTRLEWKIVEPRAPHGGRHNYNWRDLDAAVRTWQRNGIHIMVSMRFESRSWATRV